MNLKNIIEAAPGIRKILNHDKPISPVKLFKLARLVADEIESDLVAYDKAKMSAVKSYMEPDPEGQGRYRFTSPENMEKFRETMSKIDEREIHYDFPAFGIEELNGLELTGAEMYLLYLIGVLEEPTESEG